MQEHLSRSDQRGAETEPTTIQPIRFEFGSGVMFDLHARIDSVSGKLLSITNEEGTVLDEDAVIFEAFLDEDSFELLEEYFDGIGVEFSGAASINEDGEDIPGRIQFSWGDLNKAIREGRVIFEKDDETDVWFIEELFNKL
ncbi:MAG: hypothetical protein WAU07_04765 [Microgenomates group bacterium]